MERTIKVTGKGKLTVKPDTIRLRLSLERTCTDYESALKMSAELTEELRDMFAGLSFERKDLKTLNFNIETVYESYQDKDMNWKQRFVGYKFIHRLKIEFPADNERLGKVLYALAHCTSDPELSIEYTVKDPEKCKNELLANAVADSKTKAEVLSTASGVKLGDIVTIDYSRGDIDFISRPVDSFMLKSRNGMECAAARGYDIDIEADDINVSDTVAIIWNIE